MSLTSTGFVGVNRVIDVEVDASAEANVLSGAGVVYGVEIDNSRNADPVYFKMVDATSFTVGTDAPIVVLRVAGGKKRMQPFGSRGTGHSFATGVSFACTNRGGTTAGSSPKNKVRATLITN